MEDGEGKGRKAAQKAGALQFVLVGGGRCVVWCTSWCGVVQGAGALQLMLVCGVWCGALHGVVRCGVVQCGMLGLAVRGALFCCAMHV